MKGPFHGALLLGIVSAAASAHPSGAKRQDDQDQTLVKTDVFQWQIYKACPDPNRQAILQGWKDSQRYGDAIGSWVPHGDYQAAMDMYMGDRSTFQSIGDPGFDYPSRFKVSGHTTRRYRGLFDGKSEYGHAYLWVYCNEDSFWFKSCDDGENSVIFAYETESGFFNNWYITFCPSFYDSQYQVSLDQVLQRIKDGERDGTIMENYYFPGSQAATWFHESMHLSQLVSSPKMHDYAYGPEAVYDLARSGNTDQAVYNADSWTVAAGAILAQKEFNLPNPPIPYKYRPGGVTTTNVTTNGTTLKIQVVPVNGDFVPEGAGTRSQNSPFYVNESIWDIVVHGAQNTSEPSSGSNDNPEPTCGGPNAFNRTLALPVIQSFCTNENWTKQILVPAVSFGSGLTGDGRDKTLAVDDHLRLGDTDQNLWMEVYYGEDSCIGPETFDTGECEEWFHTILDGCDTDTTASKHGGSLIDVCLGYRMQALPIDDDKSPWTLKSTDPATLGTWTCKDADTLGDPHSVLIGTCTCFFSGMPGLIDSFRKPDGTACADLTQQAAGDPINN